MLAQNLAQVSILANAPNKYTCVNCNVGFQSTAEQRAHFKTEWHLYNLKRKVCKLEPIDIDGFQKIQDLTSKDAQSQAPNREARARAKSELQQQSAKARAEIEDAGEDGEEADWEEVDDEELLDEDWDEEEAEEMLARVVKPTDCLFCDTKSKDVESNIIHMNLYHGFFIPEEKYLIDLDGIMEYLGFKVGAGCTCLWCNKQFTTLHGARLHMLYKDHCKILYDHEKAIEEYKDFYDYGSQEVIKMKPVRELMLAAGKAKQRHRPEALNSRSLGKYVSKKQLMLAQKPGMLAEQNRTKRGIKKFNAIRAKTLLQVGMTHNQVMRGRLRRQNPL